MEQTYHLKSGNEFLKNIKLFTYQCSICLLLILEICFTSMILGHPDSPNKDFVFIAVPSQKEIFVLTCMYQTMLNDMLNMYVLLCQ